MQAMEVGVDALTMGCDVEAQAAIVSPKKITPRFGLANMSKDLETRCLACRVGWL
jgi:hypothetical protein